MRKILLLLFSLTYYSSFGQPSVSQSISYINSDSSDTKYLHQSFNHFKYNPVIDSLEVVLGTKLENIIGCLSLLAIDSQEHLLKTLERNMVLERLRELSEKLFQQGTPIVILDSGMNSVAHARRLNDEEKFLYVSLGNSCLSFEDWEQGLAVFNHSTHVLVRAK